MSKNLSLKSLDQEGEQIRVRDNAIDQLVKESTPIPHNVISKKKNSLILQILSSHK